MFLRALLCLIASYKVTYFHFYCGLNTYDFYQISAVVIGIISKVGKKNPELKLDSASKLHMLMGPTDSLRLHKMVS